MQWQIFIVQPYWNLSYNIHVHKSAILHSCACGATYIHASTCMHIHEYCPTWATQHNE